RRSLEQAYLQALAQLPEDSVPSPEQRWLLLETLQALDELLDGLSPAVRRLHGASLRALPAGGLVIRSAPSSEEREVVRRAAQWLALLESGGASEEDHAML
ncbi:ECF subfamily RNA polymerase sigma-24 factor, partial [Pseudomonas syringae pv. actinidiae ICMP 18807]